MFQINAENKKQLVAKISAHPGGPKNFRLTDPTVLLEKGLHTREKESVTESKNQK